MADSTSPVVEPLRFDDSSAAQLAAALNQLIDELTTFRRAGELHARHAGRDWSGYSRRWFDQQVDELMDLTTTSSRVTSSELQAVQRARAWAAAELQRRQDEAAAAAAAAAATAGS